MPHNNDRLIELQKEFARIISSEGSADEKDQNHRDFLNALYESDATGASRNANKIRSDVEQRIAKLKTLAIQEQAHTVLQTNLVNDDSKAFKVLTRLLSELKLLELQDYQSTLEGKTLTVGLSGLTPKFEDLCLAIVPFIDAAKIENIATMSPIAIIEWTAPFSELVRGFREITDVDIKSKVFLAVLKKYQYIFDQLKERIDFATPQSDDLKSIFRLTNQLAKYVDHNNQDNEIFKTLSKSIFDTTCKIDLSSIIDDDEGKELAQSHYFFLSSKAVIGNRLEKRLFFDLNISYSSILTERQFLYLTNRLINSRPAALRRGTEDEIILLLSKLASQKVGFKDQPDYQMALSDIDKYLLSIDPRSITSKEAISVFARAYPEVFHRSGVPTIQSLIWTDEKKYLNYCVDQLTKLSAIAKLSGEPVVIKLISNMAKSISLSMKNEFSAYKSVASFLSELSKLRTLLDFDTEECREARQSIGSLLSNMVNAHEFDPNQRKEKERKTKLVRDYLDDIHKAVMDAPNAEDRIALLHAASSLLEITDDDIEYLTKVREQFSNDCKQACIELDGVSISPKTLEYLFDLTDKFGKLEDKIAKEAVISIIAITKTGLLAFDNKSISKALLSKASDHYRKYIHDQINSESSLEKTKAWTHFLKLFNEQSGEDSEVNKAIGCIASAVVKDDFVLREIKGDDLIYLFELADQLSVNGRCRDALTRIVNHTQPIVMTPAIESMLLKEQTIKHLIDHIIPHIAATDHSVPGKVTRLTYIFWKSTQLESDNSQHLPENTIESFASLRKNIGRAIGSLFQDISDDDLQKISLAVIAKLLRHFEDYKNKDAYLLGGIIANAICEGHINLNNSDKDEFQIWRLGKMKDSLSEIQKKPGLKYDRLAKQKYESAMTIVDEQLQSLRSKSIQFDTLFAEQRDTGVLEFDRATTEKKSTLPTLYENETDQYEKDKFIEDVIAAFRNEDGPALKKLIQKAHEREWTSDHTEEGFYQWISKQTSWENNLRENDFGRFLKNKENGIRKLLSYPGDKRPDDEAAAVAIIRDFSNSSPGKAERDRSLAFKGRIHHLEEVSGKISMKVEAQLGPLTPPANKTQFPLTPDQRGSAPDRSLSPPDLRKKKAPSHFLTPPSTHASRFSSPAFEKSPGDRTIDTALTTHAEFKADDDRNTLRLGEQTTEMPISEEPLQRAPSAEDPVEKINIHPGLLSLPENTATLDSGLGLPESILGPSPFPREGTNGKNGLQASVTPSSSGVIASGSLSSALDNTESLPTNDTQLMDDKLGDMEAHEALDSKESLQEDVPDLISKGEYDSAMRLLAEQVEASSTKLMVLELSNSIQDWAKFSTSILQSEILPEDKRSEFKKKSDDIILYKKLFDKAVKFKVPKHERQEQQVKKKVQNIIYKRGIIPSEASSGGIEDVLAYSVLKKLISPISDVSDSIFTLCENLSHEMCTLTKECVSTFMNASAISISGRSEAQKDREDLPMGGKETNGDTELLDVAVLSEGSKEWYDWIEQHHATTPKKSAIEDFKKAFIIGDNSLDNTYEHRDIFLDLEKNMYEHALGNSNLVKGKLSEIRPALTDKQRVCVSFMYCFTVALGGGKLFDEIKSLDFKKAREMMFALVRQDFLQTQSQFVRQQIVSEACGLISSIKEKDNQSNKGQSSQLEEADDQKDRQSLVDDLHRLLKTRINDGPFMVEVRQHLMSDPQWTSKLKTGSIEELNKRTNSYVANLRKELIGASTKQSQPSTSVDEKGNQRERSRSPTR